MTESKYLQPTGYLIAALLIGYGLFSENGIFFRLVSPPTQPVAKRQANPTATPSAPVYTLTQTPIKDIRVGTRVPAYDPQLGTEIRESFAEPNWAQWVKLNLEMTKSDGSLLKMEMLRQEDWVREQIDYQFLDDEDLQNTSLSTAANSSRFLKSLPLEAPEVPLRPLFAELHDVRWLMAEMEAESVLVTISLDLPEIGVRGEAVVTGLEPCPAILPGPGKVVLTTFHHASSDLIDLYLSPRPPTGVNSPSSTHLTSASSSPTAPLTTLQTSEEALLFPRASRATSIDPSWERIGVTGNHPIWSQDRHDYVAAMDLRLGERLKNLSGDTVWVQQKLPRPGPTPVYNLEVQDEHVYYVGASGVLAHNAGDKCKSGNHSKLSKSRRNGGIDSGDEINHLNQDAVYGRMSNGPGTRISYGQGAATPLGGSASDSGSAHGQFHRSLESFFDQYREGGSLHGKLPTNLQYSDALYDALIASGKNPRDAYRLQQSARRQRIRHGHRDNIEIPRLPGKWIRTRN